ncbi:MAG: hypothetical protein ABMA64_00140 [Myxococcota bacterium]
MADDPRMVLVTVADLLERADRTLVAGWYSAVSVDAERVRAWLRAHRLPFVDPTHPTAASLVDVDQTANKLVSRSASMLSALGGAAGLAGAATVPPEWVATNVAALRLAQRLCVVYGFDPATDRGQMALCRALASGYDVELPESGPVSLRLSDLPRLFRTPRSSDVSGRLVRAMATGSMWWVVGRVTRFVPVLSASSHAIDARRQVESAGAKMKAVLRRLSDAPTVGVGELEDASELTERAAPGTPHPPR